MSVTLATNLQPDLVNQFRRLVETSPGVYKLGSAWNDVHYGHDYDSQNCMAAMGAVAAVGQARIVAAHVVAT